MSSASRIAKFSKTVYDERVRKILVFTILFFLLFVIAPFLHSRAFAAECLIDKFQTVEPNPQPITSLPKDFNGRITLVMNSECLPIGTSFKVVAYPSTVQIQDTYSIDPLGEHRAVESSNISSGDGQSLNADLNFNAEFNLLKYSNAAIPRITKPSYMGAWNVLVCLTQKQSNVPIKQCEEKHNYVARGSISIVETNSLTPTPTPEQDQPMILRNNAQCTFQVGRGDINLTAINIQPDRLYRLKWKDGAVINDALQIPANQTLGPYTLSFTIPANETKDFKTTDKRPEGYIACLDVQEKEREGQNCIRLFFKSYDPKIQEENAACSDSNSIEATPEPQSPLPPCAEWLYINGTPIPTQNQEYADSGYKNRKCGAVQTGIGPISTDPQAFVKSIFSIVLGLAGGIALILIMFSGYQIMASGGDPEKLAAGRQRFGSAIVGLLFIIFSFVILQIIGVDILKIPGFKP